MHSQFKARKTLTYSRYVYASTYIVGVAQIQFPAWREKGKEPYPTNPYTILEPRDQEIGEFYEVHECCVSDFPAQEMWEGSSGTGPFTDQHISCSSRTSRDGLWSSENVKRVGRDEEEKEKPRY